MAYTRHLPVPVQVCFIGRLDVTVAVIGPAGGDGFVDGRVGDRAAHARARARGGLGGLGVVEGVIRRRFNVPWRGRDDGRHVPVSYAVQPNVNGGQIDSVRFAASHVTSRHVRRTHMQYLERTHENDPRSILIVWRHAWRFCPWRGAWRVAWRVVRVLRGACGACGEPNKIKETARTRFAFGSPLRRHSRHPWQRAPILHGDLA